MVRNICTTCVVLQSPWQLLASNRKKGKVVCFSAGWNDKFIVKTKIDKCSQFFHIYYSFVLRRIQENC